MTREPDRFEEKAAEVGRQIDGSPWPDIVAIIAAALRQAADEALERAAQAFDELASMSVDLDSDAAARQIRALASPAAAPAAKPEKVRMTEINLNDSVWIKVTAVGKQVYRRHRITLQLDPHTLHRDADGWTRFQIWELANIFGAALYNGCTLPFETTIRVQREVSAPAPPSEPVAPERAVILRRYEPESGGGNVTPCRHCRRFFHQHMRDNHDVGWCAQPIAAPVAPSLLPRVLAFLEELPRRRAYDSNEVRALAAELRRYIAEMEGDHK